MLFIDHPASLRFNIKNLVIYDKLLLTWFSSLASKDPGGCLLANLSQDLDCLKTGLSDPLPFREFVLPSPSTDSNRRFSVFPNRVPDGEVAPLPSMEPLSHDWSLWSVSWPLNWSFLDIRGGIGWEALLRILRGTGIPEGCWDLAFPSILPFLYTGYCCETYNTLIDWFISLPMNSSLN